MNDSIPSPCMSLYLCVIDSFWEPDRCSMQQQQSLCNTPKNIITRTWPSFHSRNLGNPEQSLPHAFQVTSDLCHPKEGGKGRKKELLMMHWTTKVFLASIISGCMKLISASYIVIRTPSISLTEGIIIHLWAIFFFCWTVRAIDSCSELKLPLSLSAPFTASEPYLEGTYALCQKALCLNFITILSY